MSLVLVPRVPCRVLCRVLPASSRSHALLSASINGTTYQLTRESVDFVRQVDSVTYAALDAYPLKYHQDEKGLKEALFSFS